MLTDTLSDLRAGRLAGTVRLDLSCGLTDFPPEIYDLADSLEILNLSGNGLNSLPDDLPRLKRLKVIFLSQNQFLSLPPVLGECGALSMIGFKSNRISSLEGAAFPKALRWLILTDNRITRLPAALGNCPSLQKLMLSGNGLESLPESLAACANLELVRLAANQLPELPPWLLRLPRLAWLAFGGNPCSPIPVGESREIAVIPWRELALEEKLGEGASGVIHRARRQRSGAFGGVSGVAVKIFKGAVTSDGLPAMEMAACLAAGDHPNLIGAQGRVTGHPQAVEALVMPLIPTDFRNLAGPPSLESCTRDVYPDEFTISRPVVQQMASGLASAALHLHERGILHGDFYAHNVLWRPDGSCLLGDFGAASRCPETPGGVAAALERIEVRAFGCLLEELISFSAGHEAGGVAEVWDLLPALRNACLDPEVRSRPDFREVADLLATR